MLTIGAITGITLIQGANMRDNIAQEHIRQSLSSTSDTIFQFYEPVVSNAMLIQKWGLAGIWKMDDAASITAKLIPLMENLPQVGAIKFGNTTGRFYLLVREEDRWVTRTIAPRKRGEILWQAWDKGVVTEAHLEKISYDFMSSPWYRAGLSQSPQNQTAVSWLPPYTFNYDKTPGLSAVMSWVEGDETSVMALDVSINGLFKRISETRVGANGSAFLFDGDTSVYHPETEARAGGGNRFSSLHTEVVSQSVRDAMAAWHAKGKPSSAFMFACNGKTYWAGVLPINAETRDFWIGVVVPQADFLNKVQEKRWGILVVVLSVFALGLTMAGFVVWKYRHQLRDVPNRMVRDDHFERDVGRLIQQGEGASLEFKSTLRMNLKTGKSDKNIEIAWMKTVSAFMNTTGGIIVIGVNDDGEVVGTTPDGFENEDKCRLHFRNLMNQHIGPEFTKYLHLSIGPIDGHTVLAITCERADEPVFLINKKEDAFYVRSGPSSLSLTMRQMLKYLESRT